MGRLSETTRKGIVNTFLNEKGISQRTIAKRYLVSKNAVALTIKRYGETLMIKDSPKSGRPKGPRNQQLDSKIQSTISQNMNMSVRDLADKCKTTIGMVQRCKKRNNLKTYTKQRAPKRNQKQVVNIKPRVRKLYKLISSLKPVCIIMDDETYCKLDYKTMPGKQFYTTRDPKSVKNQDKLIRVEKFGKKALIWQAICQCGLKSTPFVTTSTLNDTIYIKECLTKRLLPLIRKHDGQTIFWPDLASCHYSRKTTDFMNLRNIRFVSKDMNPPNCPELRPIERYWAILKARLRKGFKASEDCDQLKKDWIKVAKSMDRGSVQKLMGNISKKLRDIVLNKTILE